MMVSTLLAVKDPSSSISYCIRCTAVVITSAHFLAFPCPWECEGCHVVELPEGAEEIVVTRHIPNSLINATSCFLKKSSGPAFDTWSCFLANRSRKDCSATLRQLCKQVAGHLAGARPNSVTRSPNSVTGSTQFKISTSFLVDDTRVK